MSLLSPTNTNPICALSPYVATNALNQNNTAVLEQVNRKPLYTVLFAFCFIWAGLCVFAFYLGKTSRDASVRNHFRPRRFFLCLLSALALVLSGFPLYLPIIFGFGNFNCAVLALVQMSLAPLMTCHQLVRNALIIMTARASRSSFLFSNPYEMLA